MREKRVGLRRWRLSRSKPRKPHHPTPKHKIRVWRETIEEFTEFLHALPGAIIALLLLWLLIEKVLTVAVG